MLIILTAITLAFVFLVLYGALSDLSSFRIPNWVSYGLVGLFALQSILLWGTEAPIPMFGFRLPPFMINLGIGLVVFITCLVFWARGYIGGGDAKYLVAISLWMGPIGVVQFMVLVSGLSVIMALALKASADWSFLVHASGLPKFVKQLYAKLEDNKLPFGFPIGIAALIMIPHVFGH